MEPPRKLTSRSRKRFFLHKSRIGVIYLGRGKMAWLLRIPQWEKKLYHQKLKILVKNIKCQPWKLWNRVIGPSWDIIKTTFLLIKCKTWSPCYHSNASHCVLCPVTCSVAHKRAHIRMWMCQGMNKIILFCFRGLLFWSGTNCSACFVCVISWKLYQHRIYHF